jgi:hypothetical protein
VFKHGRNRRVRGQKRKQRAEQDRIEGETLFSFASRILSGNGYILPSDSTIFPKTKIPRRNQGTFLRNEMGEKR